MTEMSPLGTLGTLKPESPASPGEAPARHPAEAGLPPFGVEMKITDDEARNLPWDGKTFGRLKVRGPAVARAYYRREDRAVLDEKASSTPATSPTIDPNGYMQITDRSKDVIKSGGEWISSIDLENIAVGHPKWPRRR
jgi:fatty-acyl-CoA synthase